MLLWLRSRRVGVLWWTTCALLIVFAVFSGSTIPMIDLLGGGLSAIPLMVLLPLILAGAVLASVGGTGDGLELVAARRVHGYDVMLVVTVSAVVAAVGWGLATAEIQPYGPAAARNVLGYIGLALIGLRYLGKNSGLIVPVGFVVVTVMTGRDPARGARPWAWPLGDSQDRSSALFAAACWVFGLIALASRRRPRRHGTAENSQEHVLCGNSGEFLVADHGGCESEERGEQVTVALVAHGQTAVAQQPKNGVLNLPPVPAEPLFGLDALAGGRDAGGDAPLAQPSAWLPTECANSQPGEVLGEFLRALGRPAGDIPGDVHARSGQYRSLLALRSVLVVLDNASSSEHVIPLLPGSATCGVLVSRRRLSGLSVHVGTDRVVIGPMSEPDSVALLHTVIDADRADAEPGTPKALAL